MRLPHSSTLSFLVLLGLVPVPVISQQFDTRARDPFTSLALQRPSLAPDFKSAFLLAKTGGFQPNPTPPRPNKALFTTVRRSAIKPSMVGYIDDPVVASEIRFRFDAALDDKTPDRAEFFYAKCGCYKAAGVDLNAPGPGTTVPKSINFQQLYIYGEFAPRPYISLFMQLPFRWLQPHLAPAGDPKFSNSGGLGDTEFGLRFSPYASPRQSVTLQLKTHVSSGDASRGLGTNHASIEPSLLVYRAITDDLTVEGEFGDSHPLSTSAGLSNSGAGGFAGDVLFYGVGPSYRVVHKERFSAAGVLELVGWNVRSGFVTDPTPGHSNNAAANIVNLKAGVRLSIGPRQSIYAGYGAALTSQTWYREIFRTEYRYAF